MDISLEDRGAPRDAPRDKLESATLADGIAKELNQESGASIVEEVPTYPSGFQRRFIVLALSLCVFLVGLDGTIIATAIPKITDTFGSTDQIGWYAAAYRIASCASQLSQGQLFDLYPLKTVFLANMVLFEAGALISGLAPSSAIFIVGRAASGLGFSGVNQGCMVLLATTAPLDQRAKYIGLVSASEFFAIAVAPLIGGALTSNLSWRWCFYVNVIAAAIPALAIVTLIESPHRRISSYRGHLDRLNQIDFLGTSIFALTVVCLLLALQWGGTVYAWSNARLIVLFALSLILFATFLAIQHRKRERAMLPLRFLQEQTVLMGTIFAFGLASTLAITQYYSAIWFQAVSGATAADSGVRMLPLVVGMLVVSVSTGFLITRLGRYKAIQCIAAIMVLVGASVQSTVTAQSGASVWVTALLLIGMGAGAGIACPFLSAQAVLRDRDVSTGMALLTFSQDFGEALSVSIAQAIFVNGLERQLREHVPQLDVQIVIGYGVTGYVDHVPADLASAIAGAYSAAVKETLILGTAMAACVVVAALLVKDHRLK